MRQAGAIALGLLIAAFAQYLAFALAAGGEGWITPFWASLLLWIVYPIALLRMTEVFWMGRGSTRSEVALVIVALASDAALVLMAFYEGIQYFQRVFVAAGEFVGVWMVIWLGWQVIAVLNLARAKDCIGRLGYADPFNEDA